MIAVAAVLLTLVSFLAAGNLGLQESRHRNTWPCLRVAGKYSNKRETCLTCLHLRGGAATCALASYQHGFVASPYVIPTQKFSMVHELHHREFECAKSVGALVDVVVGAAGGATPAIIGPISLHQIAAWATAVGLTRMSLSAIFLMSLFKRAETALSIAPMELADPFFDGWFIRLTDIEHNTSCAVIVGSLRHSGASAFSQHYIALSYSAASMAHLGANSPDELQSVHIFPNPLDVQITLDGTPMKGFLHEIDWRAPAAGRSRSFTWNSAKHGAIHISGDHIEVNFTLPGAHGECISLCAELTDAVSWGASKEFEHGPEGWLAKFAFLLPCRYFVQSLGSRSTYCLHRTRRQQQTSGVMENTKMNRWSSVESKVTGKAIAHVETNYGAAFPSGWIYVQVVGAGGLSILVTGGEFGIGPVTPLTYIVAVRGRGGFRLDFRTTDLAQVKVTFSCEQRVVRLVARGALGYGRVDLMIRDPLKKHDEQPVWVPTRAGFSREPGCSESFGASARIMAWGNEVKWQCHGRPPLEPPAIDCELQNAALEFGGNFQTQRPDLQAALPPSLLW